MTRLQAGPVAAPVPVTVRARGWGWRYAARRAWAVRGLDLDIEAGERVLLLGASGAGKSTLLAGLAGLLDSGSGRPDQGTGDEEGELLLDGVPARRARREGVTEGVARTGLLLQDPQAQTVLSRAGDDVAFGLENHAVPPQEIWPRVDAALRAVAFPYARSHPTSQLSGGERQRLALAGVLALRPGLLLLDEPTAMLDRAGAELLRHHVATAVLAGSDRGDGAVARGATMVLVEHRVEPWLPLIDRIVVLEREGGVIADGPPREVLERHGDRLAREGVWLPRRPPAPRIPPPDAADDRAGPLMSAHGLAVTRAGIPVVTGVDLTLRPGRVTCLVGPNGVGKSTLALALAGLVPPAGGELTATPRLADGADPRPYRWRPRQLVTRIGTVFQDPQHQFVAGTVAAELTVGPRQAGIAQPQIAARAADLLARLRLDRLAQANPFTLSGGEQRRLSVATALATRPRVLVLDEPTFGQDARTWVELAELLGELLADGTAMVVATHDEDLIRVMVSSGRGDVLQLGQAAATDSVTAVS